ncbi:ABC transporter substrate-binding protein [Halovulum dunhuangense]|uniref:ABC transporter substrate-binding protein n=1 Tax=Halovulum dunhuangense TaxID=1505036 RepID=A0A849L3G6_9RHOB|nr:ABC transporter substrate-binding protein [Halovulum dunhuangense]NNU80896.1 ABC transporter substrate-binding protein [Halovulum dunhuangense]
MTILRRHLLSATAGALALIAAGGLAGSAAAQDAPLRIAFGDIASVESLNLLIAMERTKERGVPMEITFFNSEDVATQAVLGGQADIGVGAPYAFIQNSGAPIRMFFRMSELLFFPVVNSEVYTDWKDLDGQEVTVHSRGSGTEALMRLMETREGIKYSQISYVPGSEVRAGAMLQGTINATIVDASAFRLLQEQGGDKFVRLSVEGVEATDEALYANTNVLDARAEDMKIFVEELLRTWKDIDDNPAIVGELREQYGLLADLPAETVAEAVPYYEEAVANGIYPLDGGSPEVVQGDIDFLSAAGQFEAGAQVNPEDFWTFGPLNAAKGM